MELKDLFVYLIIFGGLIYFIQQYKYFSKYELKPWKYIKLVNGIFIGLWFAGLYLVILIAPESVWRAQWFSRYLLRGGIATMFIILNFNAYWRSKYPQYVKRITDELTDNR